MIAMILLGVAVLFFLVDFHPGAGPVIVKIARAALAAGLLAWRAGV